MHLSVANVMALASVFVCGACTVVQVGEGARATVVKPGLLRVEPADDAGAVAVRSVGVGIVPGIKGATVGFQDELALFVFRPGDCRIVLFKPSAANVEALSAAIADMGSSGSAICITGGISK